MVADAPAGVERELAMLRTSDISLEFSQRPDGVEASFAIGSLVLDDRTERPGGERTLHIMNSTGSAANPLSATPVASIPTQLVRMLYKAKQDSSASELEIHFSQLHVEWNAETIAALLAIQRMLFGDGAAPMGEDEFVDAIEDTGEEVFAPPPTGGNEGTLK
eukprot:5568988-Prymnesium_polylepis.1